MSIWFVIANPYAYDKAMERAVAEAQQYQSEMAVVFFIEANSMDEMIHELSETGWIGAMPLLTLQDSMTGGYRALANDVLARVQRKVGDRAALTTAGVVEQPALLAYIEQLLAQGATQVIVAGSRSLSPKPNDLSENVTWLEEN